MAAAWDADNAVSKLEFSFKPYVDYDGVSPEPSTEQVGAFFDQLHIILDRPQDEEVVPTKLVNVMAEMSTAQMAYADEKLIAAYSDLLSGQPSAEQIRGLPHRLRVHFFGTVLGQVTDPT